MEALWKLEDKWKLSTQEAFFIFVCSVFAVVGLCTTAILKKKKKGRSLQKQLIEKQSGSVDVIPTNWSESGPGWGSMKKALMSSMRWSGANKWEEMESRNWQQTAIPTGPPLLAGRGGSEALESGRWSRSSVPPVWQRPILMGEKCELPRFSGLILYDEQGRSLHRSDRGPLTAVQQEKSTVPVVTTLRDLL